MSSSNVPTNVFGSNAANPTAAASLCGFVTILRFKIQDFLNIQFGGFGGSSHVDISPAECMSATEWSIRLHSPSSPTPHGMELWTKTNCRSAKIQVTFRDAFGNAVYESSSQFIQSSIPSRFLINDPWQSVAFPLVAFFLRSDVIENKHTYLVSGKNLHMDVSIQTVEPSSTFGSHATKFITANNLLSLYMSEKLADVSFNVGGRVFKGHSQIIMANAPLLADFFNQQAVDCESVLIHGIDPNVFDHLLRFVYGEQLPSESEMLKHGKDIIEAANMFDLVALKVGVESELVKKRIIDKSNVCEYLVFADAKTCALLKEYSIEFLKLHLRDVLNSPHSNELRESAELLEEVLRSVANAPRPHASYVGTQSVSSLRFELQRRGLSVDGTKEALISRLEAARN